MISLQACMPTFKSKMNLRVGFVTGGAVLAKIQGINCNLSVIHIFILSKTIERTDKTLHT